jgi:hypothetical protein
MATTKDIISAVATGDLNAANDVFDQVLAAKREDAWETARMDLARTAFDSAPVEEPTAEPVDTGITGDPAEVEEE